jgi:hypothetical protein
VNIKGLTGKDLENALMRAETKAKRRVTLSICGLGIMDEIELEEVAKKEAAIESELATEATEEKLIKTIGKPEFETQAPSPSVDQEPPIANDSKDEYRIRSIRAVKGKTLKQVPVARLKKWLEAFNELTQKGGPLSPEVQDDGFHVKAFLDNMDQQLTLEKSHD